MMSDTYTARRSVETPVGTITITEQGGAITRVTWGGEETDETALLQEAEAQLADYFAGQRQQFELPLTVHGSEAQRRACAAMIRIPFGETKTYGELAEEIEVSAQAMGQLCGKNPIAIFIPCHRVLAANSLGGFSGGRGVEDKVWLLRHEGAAGLLI